MSKLNAIKRKRESTQKTAKITRALELVSSSKLARLSEKNTQSQRYAKQLSEMINYLSDLDPEYFEQHPFLKPHRDEKVVGIIVISTDRGLCGMLNTALFRKVVEYMQMLQKNGKNIVLCTIGNKANEFFKKFNLPVLESYHKPGLSPNSSLEVCEKILSQYANNNIDAVHVFYNECQSILQQTPTQKQLLPIQQKNDTNIKTKTDYLFEPGHHEVIRVLLDRYIRYTVYQAVIENATSEEAARMMAMKNATDNAKKIIEALQLSANKARQAQITTELSEIIGGADAIT
jgi:F-type H+-transporting ATPase subunit gamma